MKKKMLMLLALFTLGSGQVQACGISCDPATFAELANSRHIGSGRIKYYFEAGLKISRGSEPDLTEVGTFHTDQSDPNKAKAALLVILKKEIPDLIIEVSTFRTMK